VPEDHRAGNSQADHIRRQRQLLSAEGAVSHFGHRGSWWADTDGDGVVPEIYVLSGTSGFRRFDNKLTPLNAFQGPGWRLRCTLSMSAFGRQEPALAGTGQRPERTTLEPDRRWILRRVSKSGLQPHFGLGTGCDSQPGFYTI